ncbi:MAG TPA: alpha/beta fold hydrolase [Acidimicrobiia bacterium]|nr:alpha/beta fold hydrolase [Acidimicrobiia bacterium]
MPGDLGFVLVHGGFHRAACWDGLLPLLDGPAVAVDLPGRGDRRAAGGATLEQFVTSVVTAVDSAPFSGVVLVGHSLAGIVVPEVARRRPDRVGHLVFVSATIPAEGRSAFSTVPWFIRPLPYWSGKRRRATDPPPAVSRWLFANDLDEAATEQLVAQLSPESAAVGLEPISRRGLSPAIGRTYVCLSRDRAMPPRRQRRQIANLGPPCQVVTLDSGHDPFYSRPAELAGVLNQTMRLVRPSQ